MESNQNWSHALSGVAGFLGGLVASVAVFTVAVQFLTPQDPLTFETQGFVSSSPYGSTTSIGLYPNNGGANPNTNVNTSTSNPTVPTPGNTPNNNGGVTPTAGNPGVPTAPTATPTALAAWTYIYTYLQQYSSMTNLTIPTCTVKGSVVTANAPGVISYTATANPTVNVQTICGLYKTSTSKFVAMGNINTMLAQFTNVIAGDYQVVCMTKLQSNPWYTAKFCTDGPLTIVNGTTPNPGNPVSPNPGPNPNPNPNGGPTITPTPTGPIDLELGIGGNGGNTASGMVMKYFFKIGNNGPNNASNFTLKVYPQGLTNIVANGATVNGTTYVYAVPSLQANGGIAFNLEGIVDPAVAGGPSVSAELCNYTDDSDSKPCNMVNLTPAEDDEAKA